MAFIVEPFKILLQRDLDIKLEKGDTKYSCKDIAVPFL